jgi:hypothetical protein
MKMVVACSSHGRWNFYSVTRRNKPEDGNLILPPSESQIWKNKELFKKFTLKCTLNKIVAADHKRSDNTYVSSRISSLDRDGTIRKSVTEVFLKPFHCAWLQFVSGPSDDI